MFIKGGNNMDVKVTIEFSLKNFVTSEELEAVDMTLEEYVSEVISIDEIAEWMDYSGSSYEVVDVEEA